MRRYANIPELTVAELQKQYGKETVALWRHLEKTDHTHASSTRPSAGQVICEYLHREMDEAVLQAYGWHRETSDGPTYPSGS